MSEIYIISITGLGPINTNKRNCKETDHLAQTRSLFSLVVSVYPSHSSASFTVKSTGSASNQLAGAATVSWPAKILPRKRYRYVIFVTSHQEAGTKVNLLDGINLSLRENSLGLIYGRSGSGKTTLLQLIAGFRKPTAGSIYVQRYGDDGLPNKFPEILDSNKVGFVFQFPERYFVAESILDEVTFGWPRQKGDSQLKELLALRLQKAFALVGLIGIPLDQDPQSLRHKTLK